MWRIDDGLLERIEEQLQTSQSPSRELFEPPAREELRKILRVALGASLTTEELRPTRFNLAYLSGQGAGIELDFALKVPVPFDVENVRSLAPIVDGPFAFLVIRRHLDALVIVGGLRCVQPVEPWSRGVPAGLLVSATGPAALAVSLAGTQLLQTAGGDVVWTPRATSQDLSLCKTIDGALTLDKGNRLVSREAPTLLRLARAMLAHRHGGTLLVLVSGSEAKGLDLRYAASSTNTAVEGWASYYDDVVGIPESAFAFEQRLMALLKFEAFLQSIASLTTVDGAVVLSSDLTLRGFGAIIASAVPNEADPDLREVAFSADGSMDEKPAPARG